MGMTLAEVMDELQELEYENWSRSFGKLITIEVTPPDVLMYSGLFYSVPMAWLRDANLQA